MKNSFIKRKPRRLKNFDYSTNGYYFITVCSFEKRQIFSKIVSTGILPAEAVTTKWGKIAEIQLLELMDRYPSVRIDNYVIMPNHIHAIIEISNNPSTAGASPCPTLSDIICTFKSLTACKCKKEGFADKLFQSSFHDHIIRNESDYEMIWNYIEVNPARWNEDKYFS